MTSISLAKLLSSKSQIRHLLADLGEGMQSQLAIHDAQGCILFGSEPGPGASRFPIELEGQVLGFVSGSKDALPIANLVQYIAAQASEKKSLANELLERYRELSMLYRFSENMAVTPQPEAIAQAALAEIQRMIKADSGAILLAGETAQDLKTIAGFGVPYRFTMDACIIDRIMQTGKAELANAIFAEECLEGLDSQKISVLGAPLKTEKRILGAILLVCDSSRVFTAGELKLLATIGLQVGPALEITRLYQVAVEKTRIEHELQLARQVQESLLPLNLPEIPGWAIARRWQPAREVSGDFFDVIPENGQALDQGQTFGQGQMYGLVIADVTDKGMPASLFMAFARSVLRACIRSGQEPASIIANANRIICEDSHEGLFTTLVYARLDPATGTVTYANAGHNPPLLYHTGSGEIELLRRTGLPLGVDTDTLYTQKTVQVHPGDRLLLYTDGITEATNPAQQEFGLERLKQDAARFHDFPVDEALDRLVNAMDEFTDHAQNLDDVTLLAVQRLSPPNQQKQAL